MLTARMVDPAATGGSFATNTTASAASSNRRTHPTAEQLEIDEINTGIYAFRRDLLGPALRQLNPDKAQGEYYLTDVIGLLAATGYAVGSVVVDDFAEVQGVNDRFQLAMAERELRARTNRAWMLAGVTMFDPRQTFIDVTVALGRDVTLFPGTILQGNTVIGDGCEIGPDTRMVDCTVEDGAIVENTVARAAIVGAEARVGPFASLSDGAKVPPMAVTGAFYKG